MIVRSVSHLQNVQTLLRSGNILMHLNCFDKSFLLFLSLMARLHWGSLCRFTSLGKRNRRVMLCIVQFCNCKARFIRKKTGYSGGFGQFLETSVACEGYSMVKFGRAAAICACRTAHRAERRGRGTAKFCEFRQSAQAGRGRMRKSDGADGRRRAFADRALCDTGVKPRRIRRAAEAGRLRNRAACGTMDENTARGTRCGACRPANEGALCDEISDQNLHTGYAV